jgi:hypothetical protein
MNEKFKAFIENHRGDIFFLALFAFFFFVLIPVSKNTEIEKIKMMADETKDCYIMGRGNVPICYPKKERLVTNLPQQVAVKKSIITECGIFTDTYVDAFKTVVPCGSKTSPVLSEEKQNKVDPRFVWDESIQKFVPAQ